ncbi:MAG: pentapeptide repeat-containing protein [Nitrospirae bacterium]|nr:pentapeptide repeat-containing protein [Nitrospirota bacterium]
MGLGKIAWKAGEIGLGFLVPGSDGLIKVSQFARESFADLKRDESNEVAYKTLEVYLSTFHAAIESKWDYDTNPLKGIYGNFDQIDIAVKPFAETYDILDAHGRSFVYDLLSELVSSMVKRGADKKASLEFTRELANTWKSELERSLLTLSSGPLANRAQDYRESMLHEFDWARYKLWLRILPLEPIEWIDFKVEGGISSIYVEPYATKRDDNCKHEECGGTGTALQGQVMVARDHGGETWPILIMGRPGMGKTCFSKVYTARVIEDEPDLYPVFVRLRIVKQFMKLKTWTAAFKEAPHLQKDSEPLMLNPTDLENKKILLVLDGLDEIALGGAGQGELKDFFDGIQQIRDHPKVQSLITSRPLTFLHDRERLEKTCAVFDIKQLVAKRQDELIGKLSNVKVVMKKGTNDNSKIVPSPKVNEFKNTLAHIDKNNEEHEKMAGQPLLLFLLWDVYTNMTQDERDMLGKGSSLGTIYDKIITSTLEREYDPELKHYKLLGINDAAGARSVLRDIALALYQIEVDYARAEEMEKYFGDRYNDMESVLMCTHAVQVGGNEDDNSQPVRRKPGGVEFFHKSIAEFLTAEAIIERLEKAVKRYEVDNKVEDFAPDIISTFGPRAIDDDLAVYLADILSNKPILCAMLTTPSGEGPLQQFIDGILEQIWLKNGITMDISKEHPAHKAKTSGFKGDPIGYETGAGFSTIRLFSVISKAVRVQNNQPHNQVKFDLILSRPKEDKITELNIDFNLCLFLNRSLSIGYHTKLVVAPARADLRLTTLPSIRLGGAELGGADFTFAHLSGADLTGANLSMVNFEHTNLIGADLSLTNLSKSNLTRADLRGANLGHANLRGADFTNAFMLNIRGITLQQLSHVKTLYNAEIDDELMRRLRKKYPKLFYKPATPYFNN